VDDIMKKLIAMVAITMMLTMVGCSKDSSEKSVAKANNNEEVYSYVVTEINGDEINGIAIDHVSEVNGGVVLSKKIDKIDEIRSGDVVEVVYEGIDYDVVSAKVADGFKKEYPETVRDEFDRVMTLQDNGKYLTHYQ
jgi:hypothetical protein